jgi:alanyl-tRNA synthetase
MQQFKPYFLGTKDPVKDFGAKRLTSSQKSFRTSDIEPVGDESHNTFFEMLGNFAVNDYFKAEAIAFAWEFLTKKLHLDSKSLWATIYAGDDLVGRDSEAETLWAQLLPKERIAAFGRDSNWWGPPGETGSCGPCTEVHVDRTGKACELGKKCLPNCGCGRFLELWNLVFTEFEKTKAGEFVQLPTKNIDTGMGLERLALVVQGKSAIFETDLFAPLIEALEKHPAFGRLEADAENLKRTRIVADHLRAAVFLIADGVEFSNKTQGYVLRRIVRRAIDQFQSMEIDFSPLVAAIAETYADPYPELKTSTPAITAAMARELEIYHRILKADVTSVYTKLHKRLGGQGATPAEEESAVPSGRPLTPEEAYHLYTTYGFSPDRLKREGYVFDAAAFDEQLKKHQDLSRSTQGAFHGGLADHEPNTVRGHTATHLLQQALRDVLGPGIAQKGSNITTERVRFDFVHPEKMTPEQVAEVERIVNEKIAADLTVYKKLITLEEANAMGAIGLFEEKYGDKVSVYLIGSDDPAKAYSKEFCGGPHVTHTGLIGGMKITKEESSSAGIRRMKALVGEALDPALKGTTVEAL